MSFLSKHNHEEAFDAFRKHFSIRSPEVEADFAAEIVQSFSRIPYENISKIIKNSKCPTLEDKIRLPLEVIEDHIERNLGGTCFSLTFFLESLFKNSGFSCYKIMADMKSGENVHCAVVVTIGRRKFLADPGLVFLSYWVVFRRDKELVTADVTEEDSLLVLGEPRSPLLYRFGNPVLIRVSFQQ